ncbi:MAG TPA: acyloxyacyl hydrolase [Kiloniellales bacterium]
MAVLGLALVAVTATAVSSPRAAASGDSPIVVASLYGGSDLSGGQPAWPPRGAPKTGVMQILPLGGEETAPIPASSPSGTPAAQPPGLQAAQNARPGDHSPADILSEVRVGVLAHDVGVFEDSREDGMDPSLEVYFTSPALLAAVWSPRPHIGIAVNTSGDTSQIYGGLTWDWPFWKPFFIEGSLGLAVHDGELNHSSGDRRDLGCRVLFRESVALGARFLERHAIAIQFAHISNANLCAGNAGLDAIGIQYGYQF